MSRVCSRKASICRANSLAIPCIAGNQTSALKNTHTVYKVKIHLHLMLWQKLDSICAFTLSSPGVLGVYPDTRKQCLRRNR